MGGRATEAGFPRGGRPRARGGRARDRRRTREGGDRCSPGDFPVVGRVQIGDVRVLGPRRLADHLRAAPITLEPNDVETLAAEIDANLPRAITPNGTARSPRQTA
jgi:hypothetical protein